MKLNTHISRYDLRIPFFKTSFTDICGRFLCGRCLLSTDSRKIHFVVEVDEWLITKIQGTQIPLGSSSSVADLHIDLPALSWSELRRPSCDFDSMVAGTTIDELRCCVAYGGRLQTRHQWILVNRKTRGGVPDLFLLYDGRVAQR